VTLSLFVKHVTLEKHVTLSLFVKHVTLEKHVTLNLLVKHVTLVKYCRSGIRDGVLRFTQGAKSSSYSAEEAYRCRGSIQTQKKHIDAEAHIDVYRCVQRQHTDAEEVYRCRGAYRCIQMRAEAAYRRRGSM
jgi:hypothetical protein